MLFLEEDNDNTGGGSEPSQQSQAPAVSQFDPKAIATEFATVLDERDQKRQQAQPKTYTPEEIAEARKALKFWEPDDAFITEFGNLETQKVAFGKLRDGLMAQNMEIVKALLEQERQQWRQQFEPVQKMLSQREEQERESRFYDGYPTLKEPKLKPVLTAVGTQLAQQGAFNGKTEEEAFAILAQGVESVLQVSNPEFKLSGASGGSSSAPRNSNSIPVTSSGNGGGAGGVGTGGGDGGGHKLPKAASLFSKIRG